LASDDEIEAAMTFHEAYAAAAGHSEPVRLAHLLSIPGAEPIDEVGLARRVGAGLPVSSVAVLRDLFGSAGVVVPEATLRRFRKAKKPLPRAQSERLYELSRVIDAVARAFRGDGARVAAFMTRPHPLLDGETPFDLARSSSAGADAVLSMLRRAEAGVAV
jgi:putative toxin-antitoxin system antitoxin component (TIGR02293 family)